MEPTLRERDARVIADIGRLRFSPLCATGGSGNYLIHEGGRKILDFSASCGPALLGYGDPGLAAAVHRATGSMAGASLLAYPNDNAVGLAEDLLRLTPGQRDRRVWFGHSGSDANDCVMRVVQAATGRSRFISFIGSYHGNLSGSMSISGHTAMTHTLPRPGLVLLPYPEDYFGGFDTDAVLRQLDFQFETTCPPEQVAAVFIEPLMSDGGLIVPPAGFLKAIEDRCRRHGILVVVDEVKVGLGRSGRLHCFEHEEIAPDIVVFGKGLGGGLPISAVVGPREILDHAPAFALQTTAGNPVCAAAGRYVLQALIDRGLVENAANMGSRLVAALRELADSHEVIGDVRGRGLVVGVELVADRDTRRPVPVTTTAKIIYRAFELGLAFVYVGLRGNVLEFTPPLTLSADEVDAGAGIIAQSLADVADGRVADADVEPYMMW